MAQPSDLSPDALDDVGMTVAHGRCEDSAEEVQVLPTLHVPHPHTLAFVQNQRLVVERPDRRKQELPLTSEDILALGHLSGTVQVIRPSPGATMLLRLGS